MKILKCHCGLVEAQINIESFEKFSGAIVQFVKEREQ